LQFIGDVIIQKTVLESIYLLSFESYAAMNNMFSL